MTEFTEQDWQDLKAARAKQLQKLVQDHHECIVFANDLIRIAENGSDSDVAAGLTKVELYNRMELEEHLQHEEQTILGPLVNEYPAHASLAIQIGQEHGSMRLMVEQMGMGSPRDGLAQFGHLLESHTILEEKELFPLIEKLFTPEQLDLVTGFTPFKVAQGAARFPRQRAEPASEGDRERWLEVVRAHFAEQGPTTGSIVLYPGYRPELCSEMATHLDLAFFDFRKEVMAPRGQVADKINFFELNNSLHQRAEAGGIVAFNIEALLSLNSELERRAWLRAFLDTEWPNPIVLPIMVFQGDVDNGHRQVCDIELFRIA